MRFAPLAFLSTVLGVAAVWFVASMRRPNEGGPAAVDSSSRPLPGPGAVLICLDTLRADALALDSGRRVLMPRLEAFARDGVAFADATAPASWTGPAITSLLTGLDPSHTGVTGLPERLRDLPDAVTTLAERVRATGRHTAAIASSQWLVPGTGALRGSTFGAVGLERDPKGSLERWNAARPKGVPFLLFLHALAAHDPYVDRDRGARGPSESQFGGLDELRARAIGAAIDGGGPFRYADVRWSIETCVRSGAARDRFEAVVGRPTFEKLFGIQRRWLDDECERDPLVPALGQRLRAAYEEGLSSVDRTVGRVLDGLDALHLPADTIIVVAGDHGEAFGEHGTLLHGRRLDDEMLRVPLIVRAPGRLGPARVVAGDAGLVDVVPTLLELMGLPIPDGLDGVSLVASCASSSNLPERPMFAFEERLRYGDRGVSVESLASVRTTRAKAVVTRDGVDRRIKRAELFDLLVDPGEEHPIPLDAIDRPCEFGDAFAEALEALGLIVPCRASARGPEPAQGRIKGG